MSNYKSTLQSNNDALSANNLDLQSLINQANALPDAGGVDLPELTNEGTAVDLAIGKQLIDSEGNVVTGTILHQNRTFAVAPVQDDDTYISSKYAANYEKRIIGDGAYLKIRNRLSHFGDVSADEVMSGKTFTSTEGLKKTGTFSIDNELNVQDSLIEQIQTALVGKAAGGGGEGEGYEEADALITGNFSTYTNSRVSSIRQEVFAFASNLKSVDFPNVKTIGSSAFYSCQALTTLSFPACTSIGSYAFQYCSSLTTISFPACKSIGNYAFWSCRCLTTASFPVCKFIGHTAFDSCRILTTISFPACTSIGSYAFQYCSSLTTISFPACTYIGSGAFGSCYNLTSLYLTNSVVCTLSNSKAFISTPIGGYSASAGTFGSIYVPASLLTAYQSATNWTYFSSRFVALGEQDGISGGSAE